jgi:hypothetical protein
VKADGLSLVRYRILFSEKLRLMEEGVTALIGINETVMLSGVEPFYLSAFLG